MKKELNRNIKVGILVLVGTVLLISALYFIGNNRNLFGAKFRLSANFQDVKGLLPGNNVRYNGIDIGTVETVMIKNDTTITVVMVIKDEMKAYIKQNAEASVGTDGLMGNKLVIIEPVNKPAPLVTDGFTLKVRRSIETEDMMRTLNKTNDDISIIAKNIKEMTYRLNAPNAFWSLLSDTVLANNLKSSIVKIRLTTDNSAIISGDLSNIVKEIKSGRGSLGALIYSDDLSNSLNQTIVKINMVSDTLGYVTGDLRSVSQRMRNGEGALGTILMDTTFARNLSKSMENIQKGTKGFDENMQALKHSILLRKYFKNQTEKEE